MGDPAIGSPIGWAIEVFTNECPYGILLGLVDETFRFRFLTFLQFANIFVVNHFVGMLCYGQHREPLEQEEI